MLAGRRPAGLLRLLARAPLLLYRLELRRVLGHRFLLLAHRGRRSGRVHHTVLEVLRYDPRTRECVVLSGWGERADWYRNLQAGPALEVQTGRERYVPEHRFLTPEEVYQELQDYVRRHRWTTGLASRLLGLPLGGPGRPSPDQIARLRGVAFRPRPSAGALWPERART